MTDHVPRWGILGAAAIGERVIPALQRSPTSRLVAIASRSLDKARAAAARYTIPLAFGSYEELLGSGAVDLLYLPLPNSLHHPWTRKALAAGLHVLCEKPLALNAAEARDIERAARAANRVVVEAFMYRHHPLYTRLLELLRAGVIGRVTTVGGHFSFLLDEPDSIVGSVALGGGALADVGCYCVHFARLVASREPVRAAAFARYDGVDRVLTGLLEFPEGPLATFTTAIDSAERHRAWVHGTTGTILIEHPWHPDANGASLLIQRHGLPDEIVTVPGEDPYFLEVEEFVAACTGKTPPRWPVADAVANMAALDALTTAAREGRVVQVG